ncbi:hypothetical protein [Ruminococcus sp.]|uniref:hypothetical protein n=1 Tax=Ruminococcus sp. TaxID=41978 RepID=UPI004029E544
MCKILETIKDGFTPNMPTGASTGEFFKGNDRKLNALVKSTTDDLGGPLSDDELAELDRQRGLEVQQQHAEKQDYIHKISDSESIMKKEKSEITTEKAKTDVEKSVNSGIIEFENGVTKEVSLYGFTTLDEFIPECIAESMTKKARAISKQVAKIIMGS